MHDKESGFGTITAMPPEGDRGAGANPVRGRGGSGELKEGATEYHEKAPAMVWPLKVADVMEGMDLGKASATKLMKETGAWYKTCGKLYVNVKDFTAYLDSLGAGHPCER